MRNRERLVPILAESLATQSRAHWLAVLERAGVPAGPVQTIDEAFADPHVQARGLVQRIDHRLADGVPVLGSPIALSRTPATLRHAPPTLGENTEEILAAAGFSEAERAALRQAGVVA